MNDSQLSSTGTPIPGTAAVFTDDLYLRAYLPPATLSAQGFGSRTMVIGFLQRVSWGKLSGALLAGICIGLAFGAYRLTGGAETPKNVQVAQSAVVAKPSLPVVAPAREPATTAVASSQKSELAPASGPKLSAEEAERLKARNRRLEALISVLRQRAQEKGSASEQQTTYLGQ